MVVWQVTKAKLLECQVQIPLASGSGQVGDRDVSSPSPSPTFMRLIQKQIAQVSGPELEVSMLLTCLERGNGKLSQKGPCATCASRGECCIWEDGKASCDACQRWKVTCDLSGWKPHSVKAKWKGGSIIDLDEDVEGELESK